MLAFELGYDECSTTMYGLLTAALEKDVQWMQQRRFNSEDSVLDDYWEVVESLFDLLGAAEPPAPGTVLQLPEDLKQELLRATVTESV